jgi:hypothetical protein
MKRKIQIILSAILLSAFVSGCRRIEKNVPPPITPQPIEAAYLQLADPGSVLCDKYIQDNSSLNITVEVLVYDNSGKLTTWKDAGTGTYPWKFSKSDLLPNPNCAACPINDCLFFKVPGQQKFIVKVTIVGDCCSKCPTCIGIDPNTNQSFIYYGKQKYSGQSANDQQFAYPLKGQKYITSVSIIPDPACEPFKDCR